MLRTSTRIISTRTFARYSSTKSNTMSNAGSGNASNTTGGTSNQPSAFDKDGAIGKQFTADGAIGGTAQKVGGPFDKDGAVGKHFNADGAVGGTVQENLGDDKKP